MINCMPIKWTSSKKWTTSKKWTDAYKNTPYQDWTRKKYKIWIQITSAEIENMIKKLPKNKSPGPYGFSTEFHQTSREEVTPLFLKLFQKIAKEGTLSSSFYEHKITLIPIQTKIPQKKEIYWPVSLLNTDAKLSTKYYQTS